MNQRPQGKLISHINRDRLTNRIRYLSKEIAFDYLNRACTMIPILTGGHVFSADIIHSFGENETSAREIDLLPLDASSYLDEHSSGEVTIAPPKWNLDRVNGADVLLVDDILDSGNTLRNVIAFLGDRPRSISVAVLLRKDVPRKVKINCEKLYVGFDAANFWVVGYGLDEKGFFRALPNICEYVNPGSKPHANPWVKEAGPY